MEGANHASEKIFLAPKDFRQDESEIIVNHGVRLDEERVMLNALREARACKATDPADPLQSNEVNRPQATLPISLVPDILPR